MHCYEDYQFLIWYAIRPFRQTISKYRMVNAMTLDDLYQMASIRLWLTLPKIKPTFQKKQIHRYLIRCMYVEILRHLKQQNQTSTLEIEPQQLDYNHHVKAFQTLLNPVEYTIFQYLLKQSTLQQISIALKLSYSHVQRIKEKMKRQFQHYLKIVSYSYC